MPRRAATQRLSSPSQHLRRLCLRLRLQLAPAAAKPPCRTEEDVSFQSIWKTPISSSASSKARKLRRRMARWCSTPKAGRRNRCRAAGAKASCPANLGILSTFGPPATGTSPAAGPSTKSSPNSGRVLRHDPLEATQEIVVSSGGRALNPRAPRPKPPMGPALPGTTPSPE